MQGRRSYPEEIPALLLFGLLDQDACWEWRGPRAGGYGQYGASKWYVHRLIYGALYGPVDPELDLDHLCRNRACVNPRHLEPVTRRENLARGSIPNGSKTHCKWGHPFDEANTRTNANGSRSCRTCDRLRAHEKRFRQDRAAFRAAVLAW